MPPPPVCIYENEISKKIIFSGLKGVRWKIRHAASVHLKPWMETTWRTTLFKSIQTFSKMIKAAIQKITKMVFIEHFMFSLLLTKKVQI